MHERADRRAPKIPGRITPASLERSALFRLERHALTEEQLRRGLKEKVRRAERHHGPTPEASAWIDEVIARCLRAGLLDDVRVATGRALALRDRGASRRGVLQKLRRKGVAEETAARVVQELDEAAGPEAELEAARAYARRRKLAGKEPQRALAALARQGFSYDIARRALAPGGDER
jgi:regulatory protein